MSGKFQQSISEAISVLVLCVEPRLGQRHCLVKVGKSTKLLFSNEADCQLSEGFTKTFLNHLISQKFFNLSS